MKVNMESAHFQDYIKQNNAESVVLEDPESNPVDTNTRNIPTINDQVTSFNEAHSKNVLLSRSTFRADYFQFG